MRRGLALLAVVGLFVACADLKRADEEPGPPDTDGGSDTGAVGADGGDPPSGDAGTDVGQPPLDFECDEPWTKEPKTKAECAPRQVKLISDGAPSIDDISIAHTSAGRVAIAFHSPTFIDEGELHFFHFVPDTSTYTPEKIVVSTGQPGAQHGFHVKLGASLPDTVHILSHDVHDGTSGDLTHFRLVNGAKPFTDSDSVVAGLQRESEIALAVDDAGNAFATARVTTGTKDGGLEIAKLVARRKQAGGAFAVMPDIADDLSPDEGPGVGAASVLFDPIGKPNVLLHHCESNSGSQPRFHVFDGTLWTAKKTVDNSNLDGYSGFSPRLAVSGNQKLAAYFYRKGQQGGAATAELRLATWSLVTDTPKIEVLGQSLPSGTLNSPRYRVAMAVDPYGLVHIAFVSPSGVNSATLEYRRQTRVDGGGTKWLRDIIDDDVIDSDQLAVVDLVVDAKARPHIAYRSGKDLKVRYVTRYDR